MNITLNIHRIVIVALIIFILLYLFCCDGSIKPPDPVIKVVTKEKIKSVHHTDTIRIPPGPPKIIYIKVKGPTDTTNKSSVVNYDYSNLVEDSLIKGEIKSQTNSSGLLLSQSLKYNPKFPKYIVRTDTIILQDSIIRSIETFTKARLKVYVGVEGCAGPKIWDIAPKIGLKMKNDKIISVGYGLINQSINLEFQAPINFKR